MTPDLEHALRGAPSHDTFQAIAQGYELMTQFVAQNAITRQTPSTQRSTMVTNYAKTSISHLEWASRGHPTRAEFLLHPGQERLRFRIHRAQIRKGPRIGYDPQDLQVTGNGVTANGKGTPPDFLFLWVADALGLVDVWAVTPQGALKARHGTQFAQAPKVNGRRWGATYRLPHVATSLTTLDQLAPPPVHQDVDLGLDAADSSEA